jgi:hypothetical protein
MRNVLTTLCIFIAANSVGQEIELLGRYGASFLGAESINFVGKDSFYFDGFYCTNGVHGKGRCEIRGNMLYLFFEKSPSKRIDSAKSPVIEMSDNKDGVYELNITCAGKDGKPIESASIQIKKSNGNAITIYSDAAGRGTYRTNWISSADLPLQIETSCIGFVSKKLTIDRLSDYNIQVFHDEFALIDKELNNGEVWTYEIDELSEDLIVMKPAKSGGEFRRYTKKNIQ